MLWPRLVFPVSTNSTVSFTIANITQLSISGSPGALTIASATAGSQPNSVSDSKTTYNVTTNSTAQRISGALNLAMPSNMTLAVALVAPAGATSAGSVSLSTTARNLVTGISNLAQSALQITYTLSATVAAAPVAGGSRTITYTLGP